MLRENGFSDAGVMPTEDVTTSSIEIFRPAGEVWAAIREPTSVARWNPIVEFARMEGSNRILELVTGDIVVECIDLRDDRNRVLAYSLVNGPIPRATHQGTIEVHSVNQGASRVRYTVRTAPGRVPDMIAGTVELALRCLATTMNRPAPDPALHPLFTST